MMKLDKSRIMEAKIWKIICVPYYVSKDDLNNLGIKVTKSITLIFEDGGEKYSAKEIVQNLWRDKAGGHRGIAGSTRGVEMSEEDFENIKKYLNTRLK